MVDYRYYIYIITMYKEEIEHAEGSLDNIYIFYEDSFIRESFLYNESDFKCFLRNP